MNLKTYIFSFDYGRRTEEKGFMKKVLRTFDTNTAVGCGIFVNNNIYHLEFLFFVTLSKDIERFDEFIINNGKNKDRIYNYFLDNVTLSFHSRGYNVKTFIGEDEVDEIITDEPNLIFQFPSKKILDELWGNRREMKPPFKVFLSHSSKDKRLIDNIFNELQKAQISAWYDKYEIDPGDSITNKINEGLDSSDMGIICISNNFLNSGTGWTTSELNFFVQRRMRDEKKRFILVNFDVPHDKLPPLVQDYRYIDFKEDNALEILINTITKRMK